MPKQKIIRQCNAVSSRTGKPCKRPPIMGGFVCLTHGGSAPQVKKKAKERMEDLIDPDRIIRSLAEIMYSNHQDILNDDGTLKDIKDWPPALARAIQSVEVLKSNRISGDGKQEDIVKYKMWDKMKAFEYMMKYMNMFEQHKSAGAESFAKAAEALVEARKRARERNG